MRMFQYLNLSCFAMDKMNQAFYSAKKKRRERERARAMETRERSNGNDDNDSNVVVDGEKMAWEKIEIIKWRERIECEGERERKDRKNEKQKYRTTQNIWYILLYAVCACVHVSLFLDMCGLGAMLKQFQNSGLWVHEPIRQRQRQRREILSRGIKPHIAFIAHIYV